ncbi:insertion sequence IS5376 putative ATP-binding protein-like [Chrysoperla carnea]|uniref:insertion sequence IS5376 putative ATP-binding protein-like n=1 Tax=Chrysoperla carnea TaxID=189513 RepID=UPI001D07D548|nr:insertion sequence IS5376 putative ATP-binding protein-like [Chrysoperla carnea]
MEYSEHYQQQMQQIGNNCSLLLELLQQTRVNDWQRCATAFKELLSLLCEDEKSHRKDNNYHRRKSAAKLPATKNLEDFDFQFQPSVDTKVISDLSTCDYINTKSNVIFIGNSGTGKTHLAIGLALKALTREYSVYFTTVSDMLYNLHIARADNSYHKKVKLLLSFDLNS